MKRESAPAEKSSGFDAFAGEYREMLDRSVSLSGESGEYFAEVKAHYLTSVLGEDFRGLLLDFGCGIGLLTRLLVKHFPQSEVDGFDISRTSVEQIELELARRATFTSNADELRVDYDAIVVANVLHHVKPEERPATMAFLAARLARNGRLFIFEHNPLNPVTRAAVDRCPFDEDAVLLRKNEAVRLLRNAGLKIERTQYIVFFPRFLRALRPLERYLGWWPIGAQYALVATTR